MYSFKRVISISMAVILSITMLAGCGGGKATISSSNTGSGDLNGELDFNDQETANENSTASNKSTSSVSADVIKKIPGANNIKNKNIDLKGATLKIGSWWGFQVNPGADETGNRERALIQLVEKTYNCKLKFMPVTTGTNPSTKASILSGKPNVDMFPVQDTLVAYDYYTSGCLLPLNDLKTIELKDNSSYVLSDITSFDGKSYGIAPITFGWLRRNYNNILICNFDITARAGYSADTIYGWVKSGEWNWSNFEKVLEGVSKLGNGIYPISDYYQYRDDYNGLYLNQQLYYSMLWANNTDWIVKSGSKYIFNSGSPQAMAVLNKYAEWGKKGYIKFDKVDTGADFTAQKAAFYNQIMNVAVLNSFSGFDYGNLPYPKGPNATSYQSRQIGLMNIVIPKGVSNPEGVAAVLAALCTPLYSEEESAALFKTDASTHAKLQGSVDYLVSLYNDSNSFNLGTALFGQQLKLGWSTNANSPGWYNMVTDVATGNRTAQSAVESFASKANSTLESVFK